MAARVPVRKAVIPCAGYGTRFLPATKASPKEMLPIVDKPVIQYIVEEAVASGIEEIILITGSNKRAIEDHFDYNFELEQALKRAGKDEQYHEIRAISDMAKFVYVRQREQLGNGHAILQAKEVVDDEPFVVVWGDELFAAKPPRIKQLIDTYHTYGGAAISAFVSSDLEAAKRYAIIKGERVSSRVMRVNDIVEKPGTAASAPYHVSVGGYLLPASIFEILERQPSGKNGEIWLVDAINELARNEPVYSYEIENGHYFDCGSKLEYLKANISFALARSDIGPGLHEFMKETVKSSHVK